MLLLLSLNSCHEIYRLTIKNDCLAGKLNIFVRSISKNQEKICIYGVIKRGTRNETLRRPYRP